MTKQFRSHSSGEQFSLTRRVKNAQATYKPHSKMEHRFSMLSSSSSRIYTALVAEGGPWERSSVEGIKWETWYGPVGEESDAVRLSPLCRSTKGCARPLRMRCRHLRQSLHPRS